MRRGRIAYSAEEMSWLEEHRDKIISDYHAAFVARFGRDDVTAAHLHGLRKRKGWKVGRAPWRMKGRSQKYSQTEIIWLRDNAELVISEYHRAFAETFGRHDVTPAHLHALRKRKGWKTGRTGQFVKGAEPVNKGKRCPEGVGGRHPNARRTQFKKGGLPHNHQGAGHERIDSKGGYVVLIVDEVNPWTGAKTRPVHKHVYLWEQVNGPVPEGHCLKCLDGNKLNTDPSNWEAIPRGLLPRLNGGKASRTIAYDSAPAELKPAILTVAKIDHAIKQKRGRAL